MSTKRKLPQKLGQPVVKQSAKFQGKAALNESSTVVSGGGSALKANISGSRTVPVVDISSDESSSDVEAEEDEDEDESEAGADVTMEDAEPTEQDAVAEDAEEVGEPSFGDLVRANNSEPIDVAGAFEDADSGAVAYPKTQLQTPSGASLGTVLTQALRTNDIPLLESCLHIREDEVIRATVQRLQSPLAGTLLHKLAERLHKRPGRAGKLLVWVQWTLVAHGGYLATQPDLVTKLTMLQKVLDGRSRGLQSVLTLKGKLDMLDAQVTLRRKMRAEQRRVQEDDDEGIIYVEGQESEEERTAKPQRLARNGGVESDDDSEESDDMPMTNGEIADSEDEEDSDEGDLVDDEAEETDADSGDEDEVDHDEQDSMDEDDESDDGVQLAPPSKIAKVAGQFSKRR